MANRALYWNRRGGGTKATDPVGPMPYSLLPGHHLERYCEFFSALRDFFSSRVMSIRDHVWAVMVTPRVITNKITNGLIN